MHRYLFSSSDDISRDERFRARQWMFSRTAPAHMEIRHLISFVTVFEERCLVGAANRLALPVESIEASIRYLERDVGAQFFEIGEGGVSVTDAARAWYPKVRRLVREVASLVVNVPCDQPASHLVMGVSSDVASLDVSAAVEMIRDAVPSARVKLRFGENGQIWFGTDEFRRQQDEFFPLWSEPFVLAIPFHREAAAKSGSLLGRLDERDWVTCPAHSSHATLLEFDGRSGDVTPAAEAESFELALSLVAAGVGVAYAPRSMVAQHPELYGLSVPGLNLSRNIGIGIPRASLVDFGVMELYTRLRERSKFDVTSEQG
ncbi:LysR family transcriptional regulator [Pandoraea anapnoica]|uniref:LysR family transcriptional regulator n=1 Tax=Pandoraea anapnoica TaxID=2508301 RepID=A0A5E5AJN9_9BURK|nr:MULTISPECIES: LysR family transcriptional regulator [Pandoraea]VVE42898.1 LysR family transcriptional regulator [Pandoraea iniqua]VVE73227.1 LysR family transcriptional regulator [Pandoraea anapnoica]